MSGLTVIDEAISQDEEAKMAGTTYRIRIVKPDFQFEAEGDKAFVLQMLNRFEGGAPELTGKPSRKGKGRSSVTSTGSIASAKDLSISEFIRQLGLKKHTDILVAFGYYLEKYSGLASFTPADINSCYYDAKMESSNTSQMIIQNIKSSRVMEAKKTKGSGKGKKSYVLTRTGEEFVEGKLSVSGH